MKPQKLFPRSASWSYPVLNRTKDPAIKLISFHFTQFYRVKLVWGSHGSWLSFIGLVG